jgi:hypothetical protein
VSLSANLIDDVQKTLSTTNDLTLIEIHAALGKKYSQPQVHEALMYLVKGDGFGRVSMSGGKYRLAR